MARALQKHCGDVTFLGPIQPASLILGKLASKALRLSTGKTYLHTHTVSLSKRIARIAEQRLASRHFDLIFSPAGSTEIAHLKTHLPIVYSSDATVRLMQNYYPQFSHLLTSSRRHANHIEQLAIEKATLVLYPSLWAAQSAVVHYHADGKKVHVVPFGANLDEPPPREAVLNRPPSKRCRLLFVGVDWQRKGGDVAFETLLSLEQRGIPTELIVVGCDPPKNRAHNNLRIVPFLNKNNSHDRTLLQKLYLEADFFLLPTREECYGIAFCEASAFGLPVIAPDTGGVTGVVRSGENGFLLPLTATASDYSDIIQHLFSDRQRYLELRRRARANYEERLNWDAWGTTVRILLEKLLLHDHHRSH
jgi:glycosyltransferase involved in cell wall biosynthesis